MMLLDTNICVLALNGSEPTVMERVRAERAELLLCSVVKAELLFGADASKSPTRNHARLRDFFASFPSLPFDDDAAREYGRLRARLRERGRPIGPNDLMIAAIALANDVALVTRNTREFERVEGLAIEAW